MQYGAWIEMRQYRLPRGDLVTFRVTDILDTCIWFKNYRVTPPSHLRDLSAECSDYSQR